MEESKYGKYIKREPIRVPTGIPGGKKRESFPGVSVSQEIFPDVSGLPANFTFMCVSESYLLPDQPHKHDHDEFLYFFPADPTNVRGFTGEVEIALGEEWEKHTITTTCVIFIPKGLVHCPIFFKRVDKPFYFGHLALAGTYTKI